MLWVLIEMDLCMVISQRSRLSSTLYEQLEPYAEFKANFHNVSIRMRQDPKTAWYKSPYLVGEVDVYEIVGKWLGEWLHPSDLSTGTRRVQKSSFMQTTTAQKHKEVEQAIVWEKVMHQMEVTAKEAATNKEQATKERTIEVQESTSQQTEHQEESDVEGGGGTKKGTPFKVKKHSNQITSGPRRKQKSTIFSQVNSLVLTKGDLDEIGDKVHDKRAKLWTQFEKQYQQALGNVQKDQCDMQIQKGRLEESVIQASEIQAILQQASTTVLDIDQTLDLIFIQLLEGPCALNQRKKTPNYHRSRVWVSILWHSLSRPSTNYIKAYLTR